MPESTRALRAGAISPFELVPRERHHHVLDRTDRHVVSSLYKQASLRRRLLPALRRASSISGKFPSITHLYDDAARVRDLTRRSNSLRSPDLGAC